jgi:hypothetical protein
MHLHACLATLPAVYRSSVHDTLSLIGAGLGDCGCDFTIDVSRAIFADGTVNLFVDHFEAEAANSVVATKRAKGRDFPLGIVVTSFLSDPTAAGNDAAGRADGLRRVAEVADFVWHLQPDLGHRQDGIDPAKCRRIEAGHSERLATIPVQTRRDVDFFLPGFPHPHRKPMLAKLEALGYHVRCGDLTLPAYIHRALMGRAKVILDPLRTQNARQTSPVRIAIAASNGLAVASERPELSALADLYDYASAFGTETYIENCIELVERADFVALGRTARDRFARERPLRPRFELLLAQAALDPYRDG